MLQVYLRMVNSKLESLFHSMQSVNWKGLESWICFAPGCITEAAVGVLYFLMKVGTCILSRCLTLTNSLNLPEMEALHGGSGSFCMFLHPKLGDQNGQLIAEWMVSIARHKQPYACVITPQMVPPSVPFYHVKYNLSPEDIARSVVLKLCTMVTNILHINVSERLPSFWIYCSKLRELPLFLPLTHSWTFN